MYRTAWGYDLTMRVLYGRHYRTRDVAVAQHVPEGSQVLELCCGPGHLYRRELRARASSYIGLDANAGFVEFLRRRGVDAREADVSTSELPESDVVLMQASLYHFLPALDAAAMVERMRAAARDRVVVSEPVRNLASSSFGPVARLGAAGAATAERGQSARFDAESLRSLMDRFRSSVLHAGAIPGGREHVYVLAGAAR